MDYKYINQLLERYWAAETTLEEEKILRTFFSQAEIPAELKPYQSLFAYEGSAKTSEKLGADFDERMLAMIEESGGETARTITLRQRLMPLFRAAAIVAVILTLGNAIQKPFNADETVGNIVGIENIGEGVSVAINIDSATIDTMRQSNLQMKSQEMGVISQEAMD
ncbi:MAG: pyruvate ferredoxin oxidoreductase [Prevotella sp.]|nr:pyruvate ferredoxin oxidoreductase [Prevotella sp.]